MDGPLCEKINGKALPGTVDRQRRAGRRHFSWCITTSTSGLPAPCCGRPAMPRTDGQVAPAWRAISSRYLEFNPRDKRRKRPISPRPGPAIRSPGNARKPHSRGGAYSMKCLTYQDDADLRRLLVKTALEVRRLQAGSRPSHAVLLSWPQDGPSQSRDFQTALRLQAHQERAVARQVCPRRDPPRGETGRVSWGQIAEEDKRAGRRAGVLSARNPPRFRKVKKVMCGSAYLLRRHNALDHRAARQERHGSRPGNEPVGGSQQDVGGVVPGALGATVATSI